jgi:GNAT superfamily N-acetyltransferase
MIKEIEYTQEVHDLVLEVFEDCIAQDYSLEGQAYFKAVIEEYDYLNQHYMFYGLFEKDKLVGIIGYQDDVITFFYVLKDEQGKGYGRQLITYVLKKMKGEYVYVDASPYALAIYEHLGFKKMEEMKIVDGIKTISMVYGGKR